MRQRETALLGTFLAKYIEGRTDVKPLTEKKYRTTNSLLVKFFGAGRMLCDINPGDADDWRRMLKETRSDKTVRKRQGHRRMSPRSFPHRASSLDRLRSSLTLGSPLASLNEFIIAGSAV